MTDPTAPGLNTHRGPQIVVSRNHRNLLRCLLSTGYLAGMLFILLMAILTATWRPRGTDAGRAASTLRCS